MIQIENTLVSDDLLEKDFVCNIQKCKGRVVLKEKRVLPGGRRTVTFRTTLCNHCTLLNSKGVERNQNTRAVCQGLGWRLGNPIINGKECVYTVFEENGSASCGIEKGTERKNQLEETDFLSFVPCPNTAIF